MQLDKLQNQDLNLIARPGLRQFCIDPARTAFADSGLLNGFLLSFSF